MGVDWSEGRWRRMLVDQRKFMWRPDSLELLARWMGIEAGATIVDSGCGMGFLGLAFRPAFGQTGTYLGVDVNRDLLRDAREKAGVWSSGARARFVEGDSLHIPMPDGCADIAICQTLLMHLENPAAAVAELARVCRPGGLVACIEPDNVAASLRGALRNTPGLDLEERLDLMRVNTLMYRGLRRQGRGDQGIGSDLNRLLHEAGLVAIDVRMCDQVYSMVPPYEGDLQGWLYSAIEKSHQDKEPEPEDLERFRKQVLDGGGTAEDIERYLEIQPRKKAATRDALDRGEYFQQSGGPLYIAIGRKV